VIRGVGRVIIFAKEMAPMISFYRDVLGLTPLESEYPPEEWQRFGTGGECELALHAISAPWRDGIEIGDPPEARRGAPSKVVLRVDELAPARDELSAKGVRFVNEGLWSDSSIQFDILDPEGNVLQLSKE
jgi:catechol 2,3-dioxygenase-like lactoylglutathione lyase family enzyme